MYYASGFVLIGDSTATASDAIDPSHRAVLRRTVRVLLVLALGVAAVAVAPVMRTPLGPAGHLTLHTVLETTSIVVAMTAFAVGSTARRRAMPGNVLGLAWAFFFVAILDLSHMLSYEGMPDFVTANTVDKAIRFWFAARTVASAALLYVAVAPWRPVVHPPLRRLALGAGGEAGDEARRRGGSAARAQEVLRSIDSRVADPNLSLAGIAGLLGLPEAEVRRIFDGTGDVFEKRLEERRLDLAMQRLRGRADRNLSVAEIAQLCGFPDVERFRRRFLVRFGDTPEAFRALPLD